MLRDIENDYRFDSSGPVCMRYETSRMPRLDALAPSLSALICDIENAEAECFRSSLPALRDIENNEVGHFRSRLPALRDIENNEVEHFRSSVPVFCDIENAEVGRSGQVCLRYVTLRMTRLDTVQYDRSVRGQVYHNNECPAQKIMKEIMKNGRTF